MVVFYKELSIPSPFNHVQKVEAQEREDILAGMSGKAVKGKVGKAKVKKLQLEETMPSPYGRRIVPEITAMKADASRKLLKKKKVSLVPVSAHRCTLSVCLLMLYDLKCRKN